MSGMPLAARLCYLLIFLQSCHNVVAMPLDPLAISAEPSVVSVLPDEQPKIPLDLPLLTLPKNMSPNPLHVRQPGPPPDRFIDYDCSRMPHICAENCFAIICQGAPRTLTHSADPPAVNNRRRGEAGVLERPFSRRTRRRVDYNVDRIDDTCLSAEEYPPASSRQGGSNAIIGGVPIREQYIQGNVIGTARMAAGTRYQVRYTNTPPGSICNSLDAFVNGQLSAADRDRICNDRGTDGGISYAQMAYTAVSQLGRIISYNQAFGAKSL